jgi:peptidoglycan/LPS O-acetylase OafA/YrhL
VHLVFLQPPIAYPGQFPGMLHYPLLNGAMWTIAYEFRCYILIGFLWKIGVLQRRQTMAVLTLLAILGTFISSVYRIHAGLDFLSNFGRPLWITGSFFEGLKFTAAFLFGSLFYLYRDVILPRSSGLFALLSGLLALVMMTNHPHISQPVLIVFGGLALFWLALRAKLGAVQRINSKWDISYGTYLYGAAIATYIRWLWPDVTPVALAAWTLALSLTCGCASWWGIERWTKMRPKVRDQGPKFSETSGSAALSPIPRAYSGRI